MTAHTLGWQSIYDSPLFVHLKKKFLFYCCQQKKGWHIVLLDVITSTFQLECIEKNREKEREKRNSFLRCFWRPLYWISHELFQMVFSEQYVRTKLPFWMLSLQHINIRGLLHHLQFKKKKTKNTFWKQQINVNIICSKAIICHSPRYEINEMGSLNKSIWMLKHLETTGNCHNNHFRSFVKNDEINLFAILKRIKTEYIVRLNACST